MKRNLLFLGAVLAALAAWSATAPFAWAAAASYKIDSSATRIRFTGHSSLHRFTGETNQARGEMMFDPQTNHLESDAQISIPVLSLVTGSSARDHGMQAMFKAEQYPDIVVVVHSVVQTDGPDSSGISRYRLRGVLRMHNVEQSLDFEMDGAADGEKVQVHGTASIDITQFGLKPPSMFGMMRVKKEVELEIDAVWRSGP